MITLPPAEQGAECYLAAGLGIEPRLEDSKSSVLPLNDPAKRGFTFLYERWRGFEPPTPSLARKYSTIELPPQKIRLVPGTGVEPV